MESLKLLKIKKRVIDGISNIEIPSDESRYQSIIFLLGQNKIGTITDFERLAKVYGGCTYVPAIEATEMTRAYIALVKRGLRPGILGHFLPTCIHPDVDLLLSARWWNVFGYDPRYHPGRTYLRIMAGRVVAMKPKPDQYDSIETIPTKIIN